jgi:hypothetical protein
MTLEGQKCNELFSYTDYIRKKKKINYDAGTQVQPFPVATEITVALAAEVPGFPSKSKVFVPPEAAGKAAAMASMLAWERLHWPTSTRPAETASPS